jgi:hypothetical protein
VENTADEAIEQARESIKETEKLTPGTQPIRKGQLLMRSKNRPSQRLMN